jgi:hypothetical protein
MNFKGSRRSRRLVRSRRRRHCRHRLETALPFRAGRRGILLTFNYCAGERNKRSTRKRSVRALPTGTHHTERPESRTRHHKAPPCSGPMLIVVFPD